MESDSKTNQTDFNHVLSYSEKKDRFKNLKISKKNYNK